VSYGTLNNDPSKVQLQVKEGIDAVIVDSVLAIRKGLTEAENKAHTGGAHGSPLAGNTADSSSNGSNGDVARMLKPTPTAAEVGSVTV
jgi:glycerophosphodiester phosphodiesterase